MATVIPIEDLRRSPTAALFEGGDGLPISIFVTAYERGSGPRLHRHPYPEVFVVEAGTALFAVDGDEFEVFEGHVTIVPAETPHRFEAAGEETLRVVSVHPSGVVEQTNL